jgi:hypothetical protein
MSEMVPLPEHGRRVANDGTDITPRFPKSHLIIQNTEKSSEPRFLNHALSAPLLLAETPQSHG